MGLMADHTVTRSKTATHNVATCSCGWSFKVPSDPKRWDPRAKDAILEGEIKRHLEKHDEQ
jgi:hypothetical protein